MLKRRTNATGKMCMQESRRIRIQRTWSDLPDIFSEVADDLCKAGSLTCRYPLKAQPVVQSEMLERFYGVIDPYLGIHVPFDIMTVSDVTAHDQYAIDFVLERFKDECGFDPSGTHHPDDPDVCWVLDPADPCKISPGVRTPVTAERQYAWFEFFGHCVIPRVSCCGCTSSCQTLIDFTVT